VNKSNLPYQFFLPRILAILGLLLSYLWIAPSQVQALSADSQDDVLGKEQTYMTGEAMADNQMVYYDLWKSGYQAGLRSSVFSAKEQTQPHKLMGSRSLFQRATCPRLLASLILLHPFNRERHLSWTSLAHHGPPWITMAYLSLGCCQVFLS
jgi:hypothetical protein